MAKKRKHSKLNGGNNGQDRFSDENEINCQPVDSTELLMKKMKYDTMKERMIESYQPWVIQTYGDLAKTKTIPLRKYERIVKVLMETDTETNSSGESSKFRFWVKSKGFTLEKPTDFKEVPSINNVEPTAAHQSNDNRTDNKQIHLYVPSLTKELGIKFYRRVAIVEHFFDIIYGVHVGLGGPGCRHAGQKRTYKTITESYAFLPREAVTKYLSGCLECKKLPDTTNYDENITTDCSTTDIESLETTPECEATTVENNTLPKGNELSYQRGKVSSNTVESIDKNEIKSEPVQLNNGNEMKSIILSKSKIDTSSINLSVDWEEKINLEGNRPVFPNLIKFENSTDFLRNPINLYDTNLSPESRLLILNDLYAKIREHYKQTETSDMKDLTASNELMSYYQALRAFYEQYVAVDTQAMKSYDGSKQLTVSTDKSTKPSTDLNPYQNNININIENCSVKSVEQIKPNDDLTIKTVDVSINLTNAAKELKISCKTTPPKKRYSVYKHTIGNQKKSDEPKHPISKPERTTKPDIKVDVGDKSTTNLTNYPIDGTSSLHQYDNYGHILSTYSQLMRSMGVTEMNALKINNLESVSSAVRDPPETQPPVEDAYAGLMKDADKLKLMLLAWNYQNSNAELFSHMNTVRNGTEGPDLNMVSGLWAQYQNALALNSSIAKLPSSRGASPTAAILRAEPSMSSPPIENPDETSSSGHKDDDDVSEDDSDDRLDQSTYDPERLKAFNMFVRLFVDENLDRMIPISKQPKEKIQAIIDSCTRQFPEFPERARKRIRTYLKSCRRNKKAREGWEATTRPTPAHLTSVQAEQILAVACENESMNAKRMRIGLDPISQAIPAGATVNSTTDSIVSAITYPLGIKTDTSEQTSIPLLTGNKTNVPLGSKSLYGTSPTPTPTSTNGLLGSQSNTSIYRTDPATSSSASYVNRSQYPTMYQSTTTTSNPMVTLPLTTSTNSTALNTPTDLSMKQAPQQQQQQHQQQQLSSPQDHNLMADRSGQSAQQQRPPLLSHKLNASEISAVRQLVTGYRESAAFLLRSADELEQLLLNQQ